MLSRIRYVFRETGANLVRNLTLTAASLITVVVSLFLIGVVLLIQNGVENSTARWRGGVEFIVFMQPDASQDQIDAVQRALDDNPQVVKDKVRFFDKQQAYDEFKRLYPESPELVDSLGVDGMPTSFRVVPKTADNSVITTIGQQFEGKPGVYKVDYSAKYVDWLRTISRFLRTVSLVFAVFLLFAGAMLIWNMIRTAMYARRREVEVMKLVGATNWFIRVPFMLEGMVQGLIGGVLALIGVWIANWAWTERVIKKIDITELQALQVTSGQFRTTALILLVLGAFIGAAGSAVAVTRFLDV
jgi:cell division transport system permease protein